MMIIFQGERAFHETHQDEVFYFIFNSYFY